MKKDFLELNKTEEDINNFFNLNIEKHLAKDEVLELKKKEPKYKEY